MKILKADSILKLANSHVIDSPQPLKLKYFWVTDLTIVFLAVTSCLLLLPLLFSDTPSDIYLILFLSLLTGLSYIALRTLFVICLLSSAITIIAFNIAIYKYCKYGDNVKNTFKNNFKQMFNKIKLKELITIVTIIIIIHISFIYLNEFKAIKPNFEWFFCLYVITTVLLPNILICYMWKKKFFTLKNIIIILISILYFAGSYSIYYYYVYPYLSTCFKSKIVYLDTTSYPYQEILPENTAPDIAWDVIKNNQDLKGNILIRTKNRNTDILVKIEPFTAVKFHAGIEAVAKSKGYTNSDIEKMMYTYSVGLTAQKRGYAFSRDLCEHNLSLLEKYSSDTLATSMAGKNDKRDIQNALDIVTKKLSIQSEGSSTENLSIQFEGSETYTVEHLRKVFQPSRDHYKSVYDNYAKYEKDNLKFLEQQETPNNGFHIHKLMDAYAKARKDNISKSMENAVGGRFGKSGADYIGNESE